MLITLLLVLGFTSSFQEGDACLDALHEMRSAERMQIVSTEVLQPNVIAYTLADGPRAGKKTAIMVCERDVSEEAVDEALEEMSADLMDDFDETDLDDPLLDDDNGTE